MADTEVSNSPPKTRKQLYVEYLQTPQWKARRRAALERAAHKCQLCGHADCELNVHHNTYDRIGHEKMTDLVVLCRLCHMRFHGYVPDIEPVERKPVPLRPQRPAKATKRKETKAERRERKAVARRAWRAEHQVLRYDGPDGVVLDRNILQTFRTNGGFRKETLRLLGVAWPPIRGWPHALYGVRISPDMVERLRQASVP